MLHLETAVFNIAAQLLDTLKEDQDGPYWQRERTDSPVPMPETTDIFNGSAGTILFFLELYRYKSDSRYIHYCNLVLQRLTKKTPKYYTFYTGATGLLYVYIKMYETTGEYRYITDAVHLTLQLKDRILEGVVKDDLLSGHAGNLFVVTYLYAHSGRQELLQLVRSIYDRLLSHVRISPQGLKWDSEKFAYDSLTGFSHGAAGIAYALLQVGNYLKDEGLIYLSAQALTYEMQYYDTEKNNWMDLRVHSRQIPAADALHWPLDSFRTRMSDTSSWAHGAAGCTLARLEAYRSDGHPLYALQASNGIKRVIQDVRKKRRLNYTLCSGYGGHALTLLHAAVVLDIPALRNEAAGVALDALSCFRLHGTYNVYSKTSSSDPALLSGIAGVGYMFLQFLLPYTGDTILYPRIRGRYTASPLYPLSTVKKNIRSLYNPLTKPLWMEHKGMLCFRKRNQVLKTAAEKLLQEKDEIFLLKELRVCTHVKLHGRTLFYSHEKGVASLPVNALTAYILQQLTISQSTKAVIDHVWQVHFPGQDRELVATSILGQVKELLRSGMITGLQ